MLEKYDEFKNKNKEISKKMGELRKQKLMLKMDQFNKKKQEIQKKMNTYVAGPSNYN